MLLWFQKRQDFHKFFTIFQLNVFLRLFHVIFCFKCPKFCLNLKVTNKNNVCFNAITRCLAILGLIWFVIFLDLLLQFKSHQIISCISLPRLPWATFFSYQSPILQLGSFANYCIDRWHDHTTTNGNVRRHLSCDNKTHPFSENINWDYINRVTPHIVLIIRCSPPHTNSSTTASSQVSPYNAKEPVWYKIGIFYHAVTTKTLLNFMIFIHALPIQAVKTSDVPPYELNISPRWQTFPPSGLQKCAPDREQAGIGRSNFVEEPKISEKEKKIR